ncbi:MAG: riboflavin synthase [Deltaproteobacteria bacterium]|nr:MAG: riboflavin synthase [Deltaproteobacteria bacterium]
MFTGIVEDMGTVESLSPLRAGTAITVATRLPMDTIGEGDSLSVSGVCLTVTRKGAGSFTADVSKETLSKSTLGGIRPGSKVNLERSLTLSGRLGGHIVYGHVDGTGVIREIRLLGEARVFHIHADPSIMKFMVYKGAVAVDGVSLTVSAALRDGFELAIIPTTLERTTLGAVRAGERVNLETDIVGKYVLKSLEGGGGGVTLDFLKDHGFS